MNEHFWPENVPSTSVPFRLNSLQLGESKWKNESQPKHWQRSLGCARKPSGTVSTEKAATTAYSRSRPPMADFIGLRTRHSG